MATTCEDVSARMMELLYGELPEGQRAAIEAHLATDSGGCHRCRAELADLQKTRAMARQVLDEPPPARAHQAILRAAAAAAAARVRAPEQRVEPARASFWDRLRARWTLPTLATIGAVAVFLLASKIFLEPEKTYQRGRQGLLPAPAEAPAANEPTTAPADVPAPANELATAPSPDEAPAAEAQPGGPIGAAPSATASRGATHASGARIGGAGTTKGGGTGGPENLGAIDAPPAIRRRAVAEPREKMKRETADHEIVAEPLPAARADRSFASPPPPRNVHPAPARAADDVVLDGEESEKSRQEEGHAGRLGGAAPNADSAKTAAPAKPAKKSFGGFDDNDVGATSGGGAPAQTSPDGALAKRAPRGQSEKESRPGPAPAPPPASAPAAAKRERTEERTEEAAEADEAPIARDKSVHKDEAPGPRDKSVPKAQAPAAHADRLFSEGRWAEAAAAYRELLRRDPRNADAGRWRQRLAVAEAALAPSAPATAPPR